MKFEFSTKEISRELEAVKRDLRRLVREPSVKVGVVGASSSHGKISMAELAAVHELGSPKQGIPERSFIRSSFDRHLSEYSDMLRVLLTQYIEGKIKLPRLLGLMGQKASADVRAQIVGGPPLTPALAPATLERKKAKALGRKDGKLRTSDGRFLSLKKVGTRPLVETGQLVAALSYEVLLDVKGGVA